MTIPPSTLAAWRKLAEEATSGPWRFDGCDIDQLTDAGKGYPLGIYPDSINIAAGKCDDCGSYGGIGLDANSAFIAIARTAVPALIEECERISSLNDVARDLEVKRVTLIHELSDKAATALAELSALRAELARVMPVYEAAVEWRATVRSWSGESMGRMITAIDAAKERAGG